jgi:hypothetical protein
MGRGKNKRAEGNEARQKKRCGVLGSYLMRGINLREKRWGRTEGRRGRYGKVSEGMSTDTAIASKGRKELGRKSEERLKGDYMAWHGMT